MKTMNRLLRTLLCLYFLSSCAGKPYLAKASHEITRIAPDKVELIWSRDDIYTVWSTFDVTIGASNDHICFLGGLESSVDNYIVCLNDSDGKLHKQFSSRNHNSLEVLPDGILVLYRNFAGVRKIDFTGKLVWEKELGGTGSNYLYIVDNQIQVLTFPEKFSVLDFNGVEIEERSGEKIYVSTKNETLSASNNMLILKNHDQVVIWKYNQFDDILEMAPLFSPGKIFVRTGQASGSVFAINRANGELLWKTDNNIVSNIVRSPSKKIVYVLTRDGALMSIKEDDGKTDIIVEFSEIPFILNGEAEVGSYQLAYNEYKHILFVALGDSRQLFAFKEQ